MTFPTPHTVQRVPWSSSGTDAHGNPIEGYGDPIDEDVYGWAVPSTDEPGTATRSRATGGDDRLVVDVKLYAPPSITVTHRDKFVIPVGPNAGTYKVEGEVQDYNHGPWGWQPGVVVNLQRVEG